jgi:hypothetical protein
VELAQSNYVFTRWTQLAFPFEHEEIVTFRLKVKPGGDNHFHFFGGKAHGRGSGIPLSRQFVQPRFPQAFFHSLHPSRVVILPLFILHFPPLFIMIIS